MHSRITSCIRTHDGRLVPQTVVTAVADRGDHVLTMRYGGDEVAEYAEKAHADYTLTARKVSDDERFYHGYVTTPETATDIAFLFDDIGPTGDKDDDLDDVFVEFLHALLDKTNTDDAQWFVEPSGRVLRTALSDYPHYLHPDACERDVALHAPESDITFTRPSNLNMRDLRFVALVEQLSPGDVFLETDASSTKVQSDTWFERACDGVGEDVTLDLQQRDDGGTQFVVVSRTPSPTTQSSTVAAENDD